MLSYTYIKMVLRQQLLYYVKNSYNILVWLMKTSLREVVKKKNYKTTNHIRAKFFDIDQILLESDVSPPSPFIFTM